MTVINSKISWTSGTLNLTVGCTKVSAACDHCYANDLVHRLMGGGFYDRMVYHPERLRDLRKFSPIKDVTGNWEPRCVFLNSLSDFWHEAIPDKFIQDALDELERHTKTIMQILTKRPGRMRRILTERYRNRGVPAHLWIGVTCEDNRVKRGLDILRDTKQQVGGFTAFTSVEPITAPADELDFGDIDWVLTGGESGPHARPMEFAWLEKVHETVLAAGIPLHFKQYGTARNNPYVRQLMFSRNIKSPHQALKLAIQQGLEKAPDEKGGATYKGRVYNEKPAHFHRLKASLNEQLV